MSATSAATTSSSSSPAAAPATTITADELGLYDRQIRVWGVDAQKRMRNARVLCVSMSGLPAEVCKNLVLAGIGALTICDHTPVVATDLASQFFLTTDDIGANRAQASAERLGALNPNVKIDVDTDDVAEKDDAFFTAFDVVLLHGCAPGIQRHVSSVLRRAYAAATSSTAAATTMASPTCLFTASTYGYYAYLFVDHITHSYTTTTTKTDATTGEKKETTKSETATFSPLADLLALAPATVASCFGRRLKSSQHVFNAVRAVLAFQHDHDGALPRTTESGLHTTHMLKWRQATFGDEDAAGAALPVDVMAECANGAGVELSPVCAVFGGIVAAEVLKVISGKDAPLNNVVVYNAREGAAVTRLLQQPTAAASS